MGPQAANPPLVTSVHLQNIHKDHVSAHHQLSLLGKRADTVSQWFGLSALVVCELSRGSG